MVNPVADEGSAAPPAKKRVASRHLVKGESSDSEDEHIFGQEEGNFKRASDEVLASRRIVKIRRNVTTASNTSVPNPFAGICLVTPAVPEISPSFAPSVQHPVPEVQLSSSPPSLSNQEKISVPSNPPGDTDADSGSKPSKSVGSVTEVVSPVSGKATLRVTEECLLREQETHDVKTDAGDAMKEGQDKIVQIKETEANSGENKESEKNELQDKETGGNTDELGNIQDGEENCVKEQQDDKFTEEEKGEACQQQRNVSSGGLTSPFVFGQLSSGTNAFSGTGLSSSPFPSSTAQPSFGTISGFASFGSSSAFGSGSAFRTGSVFGLKGENGGGFSSMPSSFSNSNGTASFPFGGQANSIPSEPLPDQQVVGSVSLQEVPVETGEELEKVVFAADATLFEFLEGVWKERGKGELKVNVPVESGGRPRLLMRSKGNYRLLLNASLFPDMKMTSMDSRGVTFACVNSAADAKKGLTTYAVKLKDGLAATGFREVVDSSKGHPSSNLQTPENSPKALH
eukprot:c27024_g1_i1 orf=668-2209(-)